MAATKTMDIGKCSCLYSPYKHFIITSLEESIKNREKEIDIIKKSIIKKGEEDIRRITIHKEAEAVIDFHRSTNEELTKIRNMVSSIPDC